MNNKQPIPVNARWLGYGGILPFLLPAINLHTSWPLFNGFALQVFVVYSALILSFLGGIRWGLALQHNPPHSQPMTLSVLPCLAALGCLLLAQPQWQIAALMLGFVIQGLLDRLYAPPEMPGWMQRLRLHLTVAVVTCHVIAMLAIQRWA